MSSIKLAAFDLDGTLFDNSVNVPDINADALRELEVRGIALMFCSGRAFEVQAEVAQNIGVHPIIASANGARIDMDCVSGASREVTIGAVYAKRAFDILMDSGMYFMAFTRGHTYIVNVDEQKRLKKHHHKEGIERHAGFDYEIVGDMNRVNSECIVNPYKFVAFGEDYDSRFDALREKLSDMDLFLSSSWRDNLEIMPRGADKGAALKYAAERLKIPESAVMAFGDNENDLPMLDVAGYPVVMDNAVYSIKSVARAIAPNNDIGGVGRFIFDNMPLFTKGDS